MNIVICINEFNRGICWYYFCYREFFYKMVRFGGFFRGGGGYRGGYGGGGMFNYGVGGGYRGFRGGRGGGGGFGKLNINVYCILFMR